MPTYSAPWMTCSCPVICFATIISHLIDQKRLCISRNPYPNGDVWVRIWGFFAQQEDPPGQGMRCPRIHQKMQQGATLRLRKRQHDAASKAPEASEFEDLRQTCCPGVFWGVIFLKAEPPQNNPQGFPTLHSSLKVGGS